MPLRAAHDPCLMERPNRNVFLTLRMFRAKNSRVAYVRMCAKGSS
jgi:hypothetical protein